LTGNVTTLVSVSTRGRLPLLAEPLLDATLLLDPGSRVHRSLLICGLPATPANRRSASVERMTVQRIEHVGQMERYEDSYRLCYVRGPEGIIVELAEQID
jgi:hypothetical protein